MSFLLALVAGIVVGGDAAHATFPGRNGRLAYVSNLDFEVWTVQADGSDPRQLTSGGGDKFDPAWSADGQRVAFSSEGAIWVVNRNGSGLSQVTVPPGRAHDEHPAWSPDGTQLAFERFPGIWTVNVDGSDPRILQHSDRRFDRAPDWSPDGTRIAFTSVRRTSAIHPTDLWTMSVNGRDRRKLTDDVGWDFDPNWSPDGARIAYEHWADIDAAGDLAWIHVVNADGTGNIELNPTGAKFPLDLAPAWSPNGARLVFMSLGGLATMRSDGTDLRVLNVDGSWPTWRPLA